MTDDLAGIDTQALDISFLISYAGTLPLDIVNVFLGRTSAENGVLKHIMEIKFARRKPLL